ncbi:hypothetical protein RJ035_002163 [Blastomyces gilchristii]
MHALIVVENQVNQRLLGKMLEIRGITRDVASNDQQALEYLGRCIHGQHLTRPDIIYMDVGRDVVHGPDITHIVRTQAPFSTDPKTKATPIIAMTNWGIPPAYPKHLWDLFTRDGEIRKPLKVADVLRTASRSCLENSACAGKERPTVNWLDLSHPRTPGDVPPFLTSLCFYYLIGISAIFVAARYVIRSLEPGIWVYFASTVYFNTMPEQLYPYRNELSQ